MVIHVNTSLFFLVNTDIPGSSQWEKGVGRHPTRAAPAPLLPPGCKEKNISGTLKTASWQGLLLPQRPERGRIPEQARAHLDHEAMLLAVVGHEDDVAVGGPDEARQAQRVVRAGRRRLHRRHLEGLDAAELRRRVEHPDASQEGGVHLVIGGGGGNMAH